MSTGVIILAAGASTRLGKPKQLLQFRGKSLVQIAAEAATGSACALTVVVTGANASLVGAELTGMPVELIENKDWQQGMSSSIKIGISHLLQVSPGIENVIIMLCDQPHINCNIINSLMEKRKEVEKPIVACAYKNTFGVPVLLNKKFFPALMSLMGQEGAKKILLSHPGEVAPVPFALGSVDIDTEGDYERLLNDL